MALFLVLLGVTSREVAELLAARPDFDGSRARVPVAVLAPLLAATSISVTLSGADLDLERSCGRLSRRHRTGYACAVVLVPSVLLAAAVGDQPGTWGSHALIRNTCGMVGAVLLTATLLPPPVTWAPTFCYVLLVYLAAPRTPAAGSIWWAWPMQAGGPDGSWVCAGLLLTAGVLAYRLRGPPVVGGPGT